MNIWYINEIILLIFIVFQYVCKETQLIMKFTTLLLMVATFAAFFVQMGYSQGLPGGENCGDEDTICPIACPCIEDECVCDDQ